MSLPTNKLFTPGFRLIADDSGSYIDDLNFIRLGPEFVLSRNTADPSAAISVSAYIAAQIAAGIAAASKIDVLPISGPYSASSITIPFTANQYKKIWVSLDWDTGFINTIAMTGLSAATYHYESVQGVVAVASAVNASAQNAWVPPGSSGITSVEMRFNLFPAPSKKAIFMSGMNITTTGYQMNGHSSDVTNDPTAIVITFNGTRTGHIYALGYK